MKTKLLFSTLAVAVLSAFTVQNASAHCQVPCGIFADQLEFEKLLEAQTTIAKANVQMAELIQENTPLNANQAARWIMTKEDHCKKVMESVAQYFMAQRIKPDADNYEKALIAAHNVMRAAMKAKQDPSAEVAEALKTAIFDLYRAYEGKEPDFHSH
ncbi:MAG: superoxide dismutase [Ni] [Verrucomicrobiales bacterium]|jgi:nickel superoxide dismutase|nr:superoxide dismutase [Ni] [Verrucomicrobiales bacterium]